MEVIHHLLALIINIMYNSTKEKLHFFFYEPKEHEEQISQDLHHGSRYEFLVTD